MDVKHLLGECSKDLVQKYSVLCAIVDVRDEPPTGGSAKLCVVVAENVVHRARRRIGGTPVDFFIMSRERFAAALESGEQHLVSVTANSRYAFGDETMAERFLNAGRHAAEIPAPAPSPATVFRFQCQPFDLLRTFDEARKKRKIVEAGVVAATLVRTVIDGYFALNRIWPPEVDRSMEVISRRDVRAADSIRRVLETSPTVLCDQPHILRNMVRLTVGSEILDRELRVEQPSAPQTPQAQRLTPPSSRPTSSRHGARAAIRSYTRLTQPTEPKSAILA